MQSKPSLLILPIRQPLLELRDPIRCQFVKELNAVGVTGGTRVPAQPAACQLALKEYYAYVERTTDEFTRLAAAHTAEEASRNIPEVTRAAR